MAWTTPGTAVAGSVLTSSFWNAQVRDNMLELAPFSAAWTNYNTPTQSGWSLGNGTIAARYLRVGSLCIYTGQINFGTTTTISSTFRVGLPFQSNIRDASGIVALEDVGASYYAGMCLVENSFDANLMVIMRYTTAGSGALASISSTTPFTWGNTDRIKWTIAYEIAPT